MTKSKYEIPAEISKVMIKENIKELRPCQKKALEKGLLDLKNLLVCTPTASGKTLIAEIAFINSISKGIGKAVYIVPLKALANEKYKEFQERYGNKIRIALSIGDMDKREDYLIDYDLIICTAEKLDSLIRHSCPWLKYVKVLIIDEIHLINDPSRGPTLEILITIIKQILKNVQLIGLSATIGNPLKLAEWLEADLIVDDWRPTKLKKGVYLDGEITFDS
ncbi:MAG: DEAD/DEAH box helicase [Candidatus Woesearchaeota archaeon]